MLRNLEFMILPTNNECIFCSIINKKNKNNILKESTNFFSIFDINPVEDKHILIISKSHKDNLLQINNKEWDDLLYFINTNVDFLKEKFSKDNFKFVSNSGEKAGQIIFHFHLHIIPY